MLDLQFFADEAQPQHVTFDDSGAAGAGESGASGDGENTHPLVNPLLAVETQGQEAEGAAEDSSQPEVEELDFGGRKVKAVDPAIKELHNDWSELNRTLQQKNQQLQEMQQRLQQYEQMVQAFQQFQQPLVQQQPPQPSPEELERMKEEFLNKFYENPLEALNEYVQRVINEQVKPVIEPIQRERQWQEQAQQLMQKYSDFQTYVPQMQQIVEQNPGLAELPNALEVLYLMAKGMTAQPQPTPEQLLSDPQFRQKILQDESIRNEVLKQYMQSKQQTNQQTPPVMGRQPGGTAPAAPEEQPKTLRDGTRAFLRWLGAR